MSQRQTLAEHVARALAALVEQQLDLFAANGLGDEAAQVAHRVLLDHWARHAVVRLMDSEGDVVRLVVQLVEGVWWPLAAVRVDDLAELAAVPDDARELTG